MGLEKARKLVLKSIQSRHTVNKKNKYLKGYYQSGRTLVPSEGILDAENYSNRDPEEGEEVLAIMTRNKNIIYPAPAIKTLDDEFVPPVDKILFPSPIEETLEDNLLELLKPVRNNAQWEIIYDTWIDPPSGWYQYFEAGNFKIIWNQPAGTPSPGTGTQSFTKTITLPANGTARITSTGVDDVGTITLASVTLTLSYPGLNVVSDLIPITAGSYTISASVTDTIPGGSGIGFIVEFLLAN